MHPAPLHSPTPGTPGPDFPISDVQPSHTGAASCEPLLRVGRFLQAVAAARSLTDQEVRQHAADCSRLMEAAYARFEAHGDPADREEAVLWMSRRDEAMRSLSPAFKAAREAEIQRAIARGTGCYFLDSADAARGAIGGRG
jgi:hypothetical protein